VKVPFIAHGDFILDESHAILKYLHAAFGAAPHWYPCDLQQRARIDSQVHCTALAALCQLVTRHQLDWHHANLRSAAAGTFQQAFLFPLLGLPVSDEMKGQCSKNLHLCLKDLDATLASALKTSAARAPLLFHSPQAAAGSFCADQPQASPISALAKSCFKYPCTSSTCCASPPITPISQLTVIQKDFAKYPRVAAWLADMSALPEYDAAHSILQVHAYYCVYFLFLVNANISF
jgi:glutathione S-transferase